MHQVPCSDYWHGKSQSEYLPFLSALRRQDRYSGTLYSTSTVADQITSNINESVLFVSPDLITSVSHQGAYNTCVIFNVALNNLLKNAEPGTGGELKLVEETMQCFVSASGAYIHVQSSPRSINQKSGEEGKLTEVGRELALVRHYFSLSTSDLSRILFVKRPTVYAWLDGKWEPKPENRNRIRKLFNIASWWREKSNLSIGKFLHEPVEGEQSLIDFLLRNTLETEAIERILVRIFEAVDKTAKSRRDHSIRAIVKRSGFKPLSAELERDRFDQITRF